MQNTTTDENLYREVKKIVQAHEANKHDLLAILLETQAIIPQQYIPMEIAQFISEQLNVPLTKIYEVITFYAALSDQPRARHIIQLCKSTVCRINKYQTLREMLEKELGISVGETTADGQFFLTYSPCFGACDIAPAFRIDEDVYGNLTEKKVKSIIDKYRGCTNA